jgi:hypothetical protein
LDLLDELVHVFSMRDSNFLKKQESNQSGKELYLLELLGLVPLAGNRLVP